MKGSRAFYLALLVAALVALSSANGISSLQKGTSTTTKVTPEEPLFPHPSSSSSSSSQRKASGNNINNKPARNTMTREKDTQASAATPLGQKRHKPSRSSSSSAEVGKKEKKETPLPPPPPAPPSPLPTPPFTLVECIFTFLGYIYSVILDLLYLFSRPFSMMLWFVHDADTTTTTTTTPAAAKHWIEQSLFTQSTSPSLFSGIWFFLCIGLFHLSCVGGVISVCKRGAEGIATTLLKFWVLIYFLDFFGQMFSSVTFAIHNSQAAFVTPTPGGYPMTRTILLPLLVQLPLAVTLFFDTLAKKFTSDMVLRYAAASFSYSLFHFRSILQVEGGHSSASMTAVLCLSIYLLALAILPAGIADIVIRTLRVVLNFLHSLTYTLLHGTYDFLRRISFSILAWFDSHPIGVFLKKRIINPLWRTISPLILPCITGLVSYSMGKSFVEAIRVLGLALDASSSVVMESTTAHTTTTVPDTPPTPLSLTSLVPLVMPVVSQCLGLMFATISTLVLTIHAIGRIFQMQMDPLQNSFFFFLLRFYVLTIKFLWQLLTPIRSLLSMIETLVIKIVEFLFICSYHQPGLTLLGVVFVNYIGIQFLNVAGIVEFSMSRIFGLSSEIEQVLSLFFSATSSLDKLTDSAFVLGLVGISQVCICLMLEEALSGCIVRTTSTSTPSFSSSSSAADLDTIAATMTDPRQCFRCGYGPVDYSGCSNLVAHHNEEATRRQGGGRGGGGGGDSRISNACPHCQWFVNDLEYWPYWSSVNGVSMTRSTHRVRVWGEVVASMRAAAKALIIPFILLKVTGSTYPVLGAFCALTYLVPWLYENFHVYNHIGIVTRGMSSSFTRYPRRTSPRAPPPLSGGPSYANDNDVDCGMSSSTTATNRTSAVENARIERSAAIQALLAAAPDRIFLAQGDICSVCLDEFPAVAVGFVKTLHTLLATQKIRQDITPPMIALRCGHCLHLACAESAVAAADSRHVRCPLCREPATLSGAVSARCFG